MPVNTNPHGHIRLTLPKFQAWLQSLNAKLFLVMALLTGLLTIAVAFLIISGFKRSVESYTKDLALGAARGVAEDIYRSDPELKYRRETAIILGTWVNPESVYQIDIFTSAWIEGSPFVEVWATSKERPEEVRKDDDEILKMMEIAEEKADLITLDGSRVAWRVYMPIKGGGVGRNANVLLKVYCNLDRWNALWKNTYALTLKALPIAILIEFTLLWALTSAFVRRPTQKILAAMKSLGEGNVSSRADLDGRDELSQIARHFDVMADELQKMSLEREALLREIQGFNETLQGRVDAALAELQAKNSELKLLMERISLLREDLSQQERLAVAGQLTAAFAHEVGTPLNLVNSHLQLLIGESAIDSQTRDRLGAIQAQIGRVGQIVKKLLGHTRRIELVREPVRFAPLLEELRQLWAPTFSAHGVLFRSDIPDACVLLIDRKQIEQLLINLVNNALDAMPDGGTITFEGKAPASDAPERSSRTLLPASAWDFSLSDTGTGIPTEIQDKVFRPMFTTKPEGKGTGLGLSICREIVRAHGGEIRIQSTIGKGATISFTLPSSNQGEMQ
ncbi:MAG: HAMP domain-containing protein [Holophagales bacterium]|jgi:signal transduction histidine kinase|nr:HAMP domain-containing protein [Holophagales bacterium]